MLKATLSATLLLIGLAGSARAQVQVNFDPLHAPTLRYGVRVGGQVTRLTGSAPDYLDIPLRPNYPGGQAGIAAELDMGWLAVQPALLFTQKGYRTKQSWTEEHNGTTYHATSLTRLRLNYLELPVNLVLTVHGVQVFAGPYVAWGLSGRYHDEFTKPVRTSEYYATYAETHFEQDRKVRFGQSSNSSYNDAFRRFDAGYTVGLGYRRGPVQLQVSHTHGTQNTFSSPYIGYNPQAKNRGFQLNLTYFFGPAQ